MLTVFSCSQIVFDCSAAEDTWHHLFNGKNLSGWTANVYPDSFEVVLVDGKNAIRANCTSEPHRSHLFYQGDTKDFAKFKNFELVVVFRGEPESNSGIFFHTDLSTRDSKLHLAKGYEVNMNNSAKEKQKTGSLYAIVGIDDPTIDDTEWTTMHLTVRGKRIIVRVNDKEVINYTEPEDVIRPANRSGRLIDHDGGAIALQAHDPDSVYYFREIRIRELP